MHKGEHAQIAARCTLGYGNKTQRTQALGKRGKGTANRVLGNRQDRDERQRLQGRRKMGRYKIQGNAEIGKDHGDRRTWESRHRERQNLTITENKSRGFSYIDLQMY